MSGPHEIMVAPPAPPFNGMAPFIAPVQDEDSLGKALKYRWRTMFLVTLALGAVSTTAVWFLVKPQFEVNSVIHVRPVVKPILEGDSDTDISRTYVTYMATQRGVILSPDLVGAALEAPEVRAEEPLKLPGDPVRNVLMNLSVERRGNTELLGLSLIGQQPKTLAAILNSIVTTYKRRHEEEKRVADAEAVKFLREEQTKLESQLRAKGEALRMLAVDAGMTTVAGGSGVDATVAAYQTMLTEVRKTRAVAEAKLKALREHEDSVDENSGILTGLEEYVANDPVLLSLRKDLRDNEMSKITDLQMGHGPQSLKAKTRPEVKALLEDLLRQRQDELRGEFLIRERRRLEAEVRESTISEEVFAAELSRAREVQGNSVSKQFLLEDMRHDREQIEGRLAQVRDQISKVEIEQNRIPRLTVKALARAPLEPNNDKRPKYAAVALVFSLLAGAGIAFLKHRGDTSYRHPTQVAAHLGMRVLGSIQNIPQAGGNLSRIEQGMREPVRGISTALLAASSPKETHSRLITSPTAGSGKSSMSINLARSLASTGRQVLLVDGDNARQGVTRSLGLPSSPGLKELLMESVTAMEAIRDTDIPRLKTLTAGACCPSFGELLMNRRAQDQLRQLFAHYDEVIVDSPPVLANSHAAVLATLVDEVVLVLRAGDSSREEAEAAKQCLAAVGSKIVGAILNGVDPKSVRYGYGYGYGYGYESNYQETGA